MALKSWICSAIIFALIAISITFIFNEKFFVPRYSPSAYPKPARSYWGKDPNAINTPSKLETFIPPFDNDKETILNEFINLWLKSEKTNPFNHNKFITDTIDYNELTTIEGTGYGINYNDFHKLIKYYNNTFDWSKYKKTILSFNHNIINIRGINIHFIRHTLNPNKPKTTVDAIMLLHGWPSSFWEFHRLLKLFTNKYKQYSMDIIVPSLPGYGLSEYPMHFSGFTTYAVAEILKDLMEKYLLYNKYVVIGGDWGSLIAHNLAYSVSENINNNNNNKLKGILLTMPICSAPLHELILLSLNSDFIFQYIANKYNVSLDRVKNLYSPIHEKFIGKAWDMVGYQHEHATRANTIGIALQSSPVSHLAWIYEKYLSWSDSFKIEKYEKNKRIIAGELSWDDVLVTNNIFYLNGKISSGIRYYTESIWTVYKYVPNILMPKTIPVGIVRFCGDAFNIGFCEKWNYENIVMNKEHENGGHFPALEYPQLMYDDIVEFINLVN